jgi:pilus assembly protein Flp/PilA
MTRFFLKLQQDVRGATAVEYGLIAALIVVAILAVLAEVAGATTGMWTNVSDAAASATDKA